MKFLHVPWVQRLFSKGVNPDIRPELLPNGSATEVKNMRPTSVDGNTGSLEAVMGEQILYQQAAVPLPTSYTLIGSAVSYGKLMEFWASDQKNLPNPGDNPTIIRIDGIIVAQSPNIPYTWDRPLQIAIEDRCLGGVVYPADHQSDPLYWSFDLMLEALANNEPTYFASYTTDVNSVALGAPVEWPRLTGLPNLVSNGLKTGQYGYSIRFRTQNGDVTNIGPETPLFSVPEYADPAVQNAYPGGRNVGGFPNAPGTATPYGIEMKFRVDNPFGYSEVEIIRQSFNDGQGLTGIGTREIIARLPILPGFTPEVTHIDPLNNNIDPELIPADEAVDQWITIRAPKSVELSDNRLLYGNFQAGNTTPNLTFSVVNGVTAFPITQSVTTTLPGGGIVNDGYANPVNNTYLKRYTSGERHGFGVMVWDPVAGKYPVADVTGATNFQFPNRRDPKTGRSFDYSDAPIYAGTTDCQSAANGVAPTFDAFTQGTFQKNGGTELINVINNGDQYNPWGPNTVADDNTEYNVRPLNGRVTEYSSPTGPTILPDAGSIWAPVHHSLGIAINGITGLPSGAKAFTIMRTPPAGRVTCQGLATYDLTANPVNPSLPANKSTSSFLFSSPDLFSGIVPQAKREQMEQHPQDFKFQCVAPLGFYSDIYGYYRFRARGPQSQTGATYTFPDMVTPQLGGSGFTDPAPPSYASTTYSAYGIDMLSYAGIQHDEGQVNVGEPTAGGMAYQPGTGSNGAPNGNYVSYGAWRGQRPPNNQGAPTGGQLNYSFWHQGTNDGNATFIPNSITPVNLSDRGMCWRIDAGAEVYTPGGISTNDEVAFDNSRVRVFHQPWYVVNIIEDGANVPPDPEWLSTGMTIKTEGTVGIVPSASTAEFTLINERLDDCRPWLVTDYRYVYIRTPGVEDRAWICLSNFAAAPPATILADIANNGFWVAPDGTLVYGVYEAFKDPDRISFGTYGTGSAMPPAGSRVVVKYNPEAPIRTFGGDTTVSPAIHATMDRISNYAPGGTSTVVLNNPAVADPFKLGFLPLPYPGFSRNLNWRMPIESTNYDPQALVPCMSTLRQWCVLWDAESRTPGRYNLVGPEGPPRQNRESAFPNVHYVARPYEYVSDTTGFWPEYQTDYPGEQTDRGGIRFLPSHNFDYARQSDPSGVGIIAGFDPRTDFCNAIAASNERNPLVEEGPALRTFLSSNIVGISQENGEIKYIASSVGPSGRNVYAWTQRGVCRLLTNKSILYGASGEQISTQQVSTYWGPELWLSRNIGSPDQMWRLLTKAPAPSGASYADSFFWPNRNGFFRMTGDAIMDISDDKFMSVVGPTLSNYPTDYTPQSSAFYNRIQNEAWFSIAEQVLPPRPPLIPVPVILPRRLFVYNAEINEWVGEFTYAFDGYNQVDRQIVGMRDLTTFGLDKGYVIGTDIREASVTVPMVGNVGMYKQMERFRVTGTRPDRIEVLNKDFELVWRWDQSIAALANPAEAQYWVLRMDSWENWVGAQNIVNGVFTPTDLLVQDEFFYLRAIWNTAGDKTCLSLSSQLRDLP